MNYAGDAKKVNKTVEQLHNIFVLDRSGSMTWDIDTAIENTKDALKVILTPTFISVIWFKRCGSMQNPYQGS